MDFPFADPPGIIRANQKDAYVETDLYKRIRDVLQSIKGVRFTHNWSNQIQILTTFLYLGLTTLSGSRTLGEEYTDLFYLTPSRQLPSRLKLALYVLTTGLAPALIPKISAIMRLLLRKWSKTSASLEGSGSDGYDDNLDDKASWIEEHLTPATLISINLALFYFSGAYYQVSKRIFGLRYAFGHRVDPLTQPSGSYELISVLMITRALFKMVKAVRSQLSTVDDEASGQAKQIDVSEMGWSMEDPEVLPFIRDESRRCNLCLEEMRAPTVTLCGHMYCWYCISGWCREHGECPLCRQECKEQHLLCVKVDL